MPSWTEQLGPRSQIHDHDSHSETGSDLRTLRAAYRNRTDDLRITRSPGYRPGRATCTESRTCVPECSECTVRSEFRATTRATARPAFRLQSVTGIAGRLLEKVTGTPEPADFIGLAGWRLGGGEPQALPPGSEPHRSGPPG